MIANFERICHNKNIKSKKSNFYVKIFNNKKSRDKYYPRSFCQKISLIKTLPLLLR